MGVLFAERLDHKKLLARALVCGMFAAALHGQAPGPTSMFRGHPNHAGVSGEKGPRNLKIVKWRFTTQGKVRSSPAVARGIVCVGSEDGHLYALDAATGSLRWKVQTGGNLSSSPAIVNGEVYVTGGDGAVYAFDLGTGLRRWSFATGPPKSYALFGSDSRTHDYWASSPVVSDGMVYVGSADGGVYALDALTGRPKWSLDTGASVRSSPALAQGRVFVGTMDGNLVAIEAATGRTTWRFKTQGNPFFPAGEIQSSPAAVDGSVFVGARDGVLYALDAVTGQPRWVADNEMAWVNASPAVASQLVVFGVSDGESVIAVDARTGAPRWRFKTNGRVFSSPTVADGRVYVGNSYGNVYVLDAATGGLLDQGYTEGAVHSSPAVAGSVLYVGSDDSCVYAFEERSAPARRAMPVSDPVLARYAGTYRFSPQLAFVVRPRPNGRVSIQIGERSPFELAAAGDSEFFHEKADLQVRFVSDASGRVTEMVLTQSGIEGRLRRVE